MSRAQRLRLAGSLALALLGAAAFGGTSSGVAMAAAVAPEAAPVAALDTALITTMKAGSANASFPSRYAALAPVVEKTLNLPVILQNSVGFLWPTLSAAQQSELTEVFQQFTIASYVNGFGGYGGERFDVLPSERAYGAKKIVETQIVPADGSTPTRLDYVMANGAAGWQIVDVLLNGTISKVAIQSSDFSSLVTSGDANQLIGALKTKIFILSHGTLGKQA